MERDYSEFLKSKMIRAVSEGFSVDRDEICKAAFEWQKDVILWALKKGRCALFQDCGMGKTLEQLAWAEQVHRHTGKPVLILAPLAVVDQTVKEAEKFGISCTAVRSPERICGVCAANYEIAEKFDFSQLGGIVLDESSILKSFTGRTKQFLVDACAQIPFRLCCTATPSPNDYTELGNHAEFLGIMSRSEMLATFFVHDGGNTSLWRLKGHATSSFFEWVASWACCMRGPADLGYDSTGYCLPKLKIFEHIVKSNHLTDREGQEMLFAPAVQTLSERRDNRRNSLMDRCRVAAEIVNGDSSQCLVWCDLNDESGQLAKLITDSVEVRGSDPAEEKTKRMQAFSDGSAKCLISKPSIAGWGMNWQQCHRMIFVGLSDSFEAYYQAVRRCFRFGQKNRVDVHIVVSDADGAVKLNMERKQAEADTMKKELVKYTKDILQADIRSTTRMTQTYFATQRMKIPSWIGGNVA